MFGVSVMGGYVYCGEVILEFVGCYIFGDFVLGMVWGLCEGGDG